MNASIYGFARTSSTSNFLHGQDELDDLKILYRNGIQSGLAIAELTCLQDELVNLACSKAEQQLSQLEPEASHSYGLTLPSTLPPTLRLGTNRVSFTALYFPWDFEGSQERLERDWPATSFLGRRVSIHFITPARFK